LAKAKQLLRKKEGSSNFDEDKLSIVMSLFTLLFAAKIGLIARITSVVESRAIARISAK
jgi:hypothetical protein